MALVDALSLAQLFKDDGYVPFHRTPRTAAAAHRIFWTRSNKHKQGPGDTPLNRDLKFLWRWVGVAMAAGVPLEAQGINLGNRRYVRLDKAVINSCINQRLLDLNETTGVFELTIRGLEILGFSR